jgi:hypothetical protein
LECAVFTDRQYEAEGAWGHTERQLHRSLVRSQPPFERDRHDADRSMPQIAGSRASFSGTKYAYAQSPEIRVQRSLSLSVHLDARGDV